MQPVTETAERSTCIDVERRFPAYRVGYEDPVYQSTQDPWHKVVVCKHGTICPAGDDQLWACTKENATRLAKRFLLADWMRGRDKNSSELAALASSEIRKGDGSQWRFSATEIERARKNPIPVVVDMDACDGMNVAFDVKDWKVLFKLMGAVRR